VNRADVTVIATPSDCDVVIQRQAVVGWIEVHPSRAGTTRNTRRAKRRRPLCEDGRAGEEYAHTRLQRSVQHGYWSWLRDE
jgi:hypothetical protein